MLETDHPHARGENADISAARAAETGPSPRTWGERDRHRHSGAELRTIPTHVGRTPKRSPAGCIASDHPHARGENVLFAVAHRASPGPSPRTWGERRRYAGSEVVFRTIPTHVGRTPKRVLLPTLVSDHPHARGENSHHRRFCPRLCGPSPRTWGEPLSVTHPKA